MKLTCEAPFGNIGGESQRQGEISKPSREELRAIGRLISTHAQVRAEIRFVTRQIEEGHCQSGELRRVIQRSRAGAERAEEGLTRLTLRSSSQVLQGMEARLGRHMEQLQDLHARLLRIEGLLGGLDVAERAVIHARLIEGRCWPHVAYDTHISERQCTRILNRGLEKIHRALKGEQERERERDGAPD